MAVVDFVVFNQTAPSADQRILVVLPLEGLSEDARPYTWQVLNPPPKGGRQSFQYTGRVEVIAAEDRDQGSRSAQRTALPGSRFQAQAEWGQGPELVLTELQDDLRIEVTNPDTSGQPTLRAIWSSEGRPFLEQRGVTPGSSAGVELMENLLVFRITKPPANGFCPPAEAEDPVYEYRIPAGTSRVEVTWIETDEGFDLEFQPPSADEREPLEAEPTETEPTETEPEEASEKSKKSGTRHKATARRKKKED